MSIAPPATAEGRLRIGVDLGGTKIEAVALRPDGAIAWRERVATPQGDYAGTVGAVVALVGAAERAIGQRGSVGVGIPGTLSARTGRVKNANSVCLNGQPLREDLSAALAREVRVANDANCFAISEAADGAAEGAASVFGVILGTGVGAGLVIDGRIVVGANAIAGEWGHNPLPPRLQREPAPDDRFTPAFASGVDETPGPRCYCGRRGCLETWLSGPGLARDAGRSDADASAVVAAMRDGDPAACQAFDRYVDRLARGLACVINIVDPACIVLGGGLSMIDELYEALPARLPAYVFTDALVTSVRRHRHGDASGVRGAAWLWPASD